MVRLMIKKVEQSHAIMDQPLHVACQTTPQNEPLDDNGYQEYNIPQSPDEAECMFCLCRPCITHEHNRQFWWEDNNEAPCRRNSALRKEKYN